MDPSTEGRAGWLILILEGRTITMPLWGFPDTAGLLGSFGSSGPGRRPLILAGQPYKLLELQARFLGPGHKSLVWTGDMATG